MAMNTTQYAKLIKGMTAVHGIPNLIGSPGTGKTSFIRSLSREWLGIDPIVVLLHNGESSDISGLPFLEDDPQHNTTFMGVAMPRWAAKAIELARENPLGVLVFFDEISNLPEGHQASALTLFEDRIMGTVKFPDNVYFISAMNKPEEAANGHVLSPPLANRLAHIEWDMTPGEFVRLFRDNFGQPMSASEKMVRMQLASFLVEHTTHAYKLPERDSDRGKAYPTYRTWDKLARTLSSEELVGEFENVSELVAVAARAWIGDTVTPILVTWLKNNSLPSIQNVVANPDNYDWADEDRYHQDAVLSLAENILETISSDADNPSPQSHVDAARVAVLKMANVRPVIAIRLAQMVSKSGMNKSGKPSPRYTLLFDEKKGKFAGKKIGDVFPGIQTVIDNQVEVQDRIKDERKQAEANRSKK